MEDCKFGISSMATVETAETVCPNENEEIVKPAATEKPVRNVYAIIDPQDFIDHAFTLTTGTIYMSKKQMVLGVTYVLSGEQMRCRLFVKTTKPLTKSESDQILNAVNGNARLGLVEATPTRNFDFFSDPTNTIISRGEPFPEMSVYDRHVTAATAIFLRRSVLEVMEMPVKCASEKVGASSKTLEFLAAICSTMVMDHYAENVSMLEKEFPDFLRESMESASPRMDEVSAKMQSIKKRAKAMLADIVDRYDDQISDPSVVQADTTAEKERSTIIESKSLLLKLLDGLELVKDDEEVEPPAKKSKIKLNESFPWYTNGKLYFIDTSS